MRLTPHMWEALIAASHQELRRTHTLTPGADPWPHPAASLHALVRRGLLTVGEIRNRHGLRVTVWAITDAGREALEPVEVHRVERPLYMTRTGSIRYTKLPNGRWTVDTNGATGDYSSDPRRSIDHDYAPGSKRAVAVAVVSPADLRSFASRARGRETERQRERGAVIDEMSISRRLFQLREIGRARHADVTSECRLIRHMLATGRESDALARLTAVEARLGQRAA